MIPFDTSPRAGLTLCATTAFLLVSLYAGLALGQPAFDPPEVRAAADDAYQT